MVSDMVKDHSDSEIVVNNSLVAKGYFLTAMSATD